jgi:hypothetical protein
MRDAVADRAPEKQQQTDGVETAAEARDGL